jgi:hypothetical protein
MCRRLGADGAAVIEAHAPRVVGLAGLGAGARAVAAAARAARLLASRRAAAWHAAAVDAVVSGVTLTGGAAGLRIRWTESAVLARTPDAVRGAEHAVTEGALRCAVQVGDRGVWKCGLRRWCWYVRPPHEDSEVPSRKSFAEVTLELLGHAMTMALYW